MRTNDTITEEQAADLLTLANEGYGLATCCEDLGLDLETVRSHLDNDAGLRLATRLELAALRAEVLALGKALARRGIRVRLERVR